MSSKYEVVHLALAIFMMKDGNNFLFDVDYVHYCYNS